MTERKTNGHSPLVEIIAEVYDTKRRMKEVINKAIETNSDDFEEYGVLTTNARNTMWNNGIADGWSDGWHSVFPNDPIDPDDYEEYLRPLETYTPSIPQYSTETYIDNLVTIMQDNYRCRLLIKDALDTNSEEFVTYPDLLDAYLESEYNTAYDQAYQEAYEQAVDLSYTPPTIEQHYLTAEIINNADFGSLYYWTDGETIDNKHPYTVPISITHRMNIWAVLFYNGRYSQIVHRVLIIPEEEELTVEIIQEVRKGSGDYGYSYITVCDADEINVDDGGWDDLTYTEGRIYTFIGQHWFDDPDATLDGWNGDVTQIKIYDIKKGSCIRFRREYTGTNVNGTGPTLVGTISTSGSNWESLNEQLDYNVFGNFLSLFDKYNFSTITNLRTIPAYLYQEEHNINGEGTIVFNSGSMPFHLYDFENVGFTATILTDNCYNNMFTEAKGKYVPHMPAANVKKRCYYGMFADCINITSGPDLQATTLADNCYGFMFEHCSRLSNIKCLATDLSASNPTTGWLSGVSSTGTFTKASGVTWPSGDSGIPTGWTVVNAA